MHHLESLMNPSTQEKLAKLKAYAKLGALPDGRPFTYSDYFRVKGQLLAQEEQESPATKEDVIKVFGEEPEFLK